MSKKLTLNLQAADFRENSLLLENVDSPDFETAFESQRRVQLMIEKWNVNVFGEIFPFPFKILWFVEDLVRFDASEKEENWKNS